MKKTIRLCATMSMAVALSAFLSITSIASDMKQTINAEKENNLLLSPEVSTTVVEGSIPKMGLKSLKKKFASSYKDLNQLKTESNDLCSQIKTLSKNIKEQRKDFKADLAIKDKKEKKNILYDMNSKIEPIKVKVNNLNLEINTLNNQKAAEWIDFKTALKIGHESNASIALNNIISIKKQIIEKQKSLLELKKEILNTLFI